MEYFITKMKRNNLIITSIIVMLNYIILGTSFLYIGKIKLDSLIIGVLGLIVIIALAYIYIFLINYFKKYSLTGLQITTTIFLITEVVSQAIPVIGSFGLMVPNYVSSIFGFVGIITMIIWIVQILRINKEDYSAISSLKNYAYAIIFAIILGIIISLMTMYGRYPYPQLSMLPIAIPFYFIIDFVQKLKTKEENPDSRQYKF